MLCAKLSPELEVVTHTQSWAFHGSHEEQQQVTEKAAHGIRAGKKQQVSQSLRENHREPDEEQSTNSRP